MYFGKPTRARNTFFAILSFAISSFALYSWATFKGIPHQSELQTASGSVAWVESGKYGIKFRLDGVPKSFDYASKGNAMGLVFNTLSRSDHPVITVGFDPHPRRGPIFSNEAYYSVFELSVAGKPLRSHDEIAEAWQSDQNVAVWLAVFFMLGGIYLSWAALRHRDAT